MGSIYATLLSELLDDQVVELCCRLLLAVHHEQGQLGFDSQVLRVLENHSLDQPLNQSVHELLNIFEY